MLKLTPLRTNNVLNEVVNFRLVRGQPGPDFVLKIYE